MIGLKINRLDRLHRDRGYRFSDRDPDMEWICQVIEKSGLSIPDVIEAVLDVSGDSVFISYGCIARWLNGSTRRPQNFTLTWVARGLGYDRDWKTVPRLVADNSRKGRQA